MAPPNGDEPADERDSAFVAAGAAGPGRAWVFLERILSTRGPFAVPTIDDLADERLRRTLRKVTSRHRLLAIAGAFGMEVRKSVRGIDPIAFDLWDRLKSHHRDRVRAAFFGMIETLQAQVEALKSRQQHLILSELADPDGVGRSSGAELARQIMAIDQVDELEAMLGKVATTSVEVNQESLNILLPISEAAKRENLSTETVRGWVNRRRDPLPVHRGKGVLMVNLAEVRAERLAKEECNVNRRGQRTPTNAPKSIEPGADH